MAALYDHLISLIIAGTVVLILAGVQVRGQRVAVERTMMYAAKKYTLSLAGVLEADLANVGFESVPGQPSIETHQTTTIDGVEVTERFVFYGRGSGGDRTKIKYEVEKTGEKTLGEGGPVPLFQWTREECLSGGCSSMSSAGWNQDGRSSSTFADFDIELLNGAGTEASGPGEARQIRVRTVNGVAPGAGAGFLPGQRRLYWSIVLKPSSMQY